MMHIKRFVIIAIGVANVSAIDVPALNDGEVASIVEQPRKNLRGVVTDTSAAIDDSDVSTEAVDWLAAAHRMLRNKKKKNKLTAALSALLGKKNNGKKNNGKKNKGKKNNGNGKKNGNKNKVKNPVQLNSERAECTDRGNKKWCTNEWQPDSGECKWSKGECSTGRASCDYRGNEKWCMNEWQPSDGDCEWTNGKCSTVATDTNERKECNERRNENWCLNKWQPTSGDCEWSNDMCQTAMIECPEKPQLGCDKLEWPNMYDSDPKKTPLEFIARIKQEDLHSIKTDATFEYEVPILFKESSCDGLDDYVKVGIRRKKGAAIINDGLTKVSYKININKFKHECKGAHDWHGIKKLSLENGDNMDVVSEQLVWQMAKLANAEGLFGDHYKPGLANLVKLTFEIVPEHEDLHSYDGHVDIEEAGVYVNAEQVDHQFFKNRMEEGDDNLLYLYKSADSKTPLEKKKEACDSTDSPTLTSLKCHLFGNGGQCDADEVDDHVNMDVLLTHAAIEAVTTTYSGALDGQNMFIADYVTGTCPDVYKATKKREVYAWDLDYCFKHHRIDRSIYGCDRSSGKQTKQQEFIFSNQGFLDTYNDKMKRLVATGNGDIINKAFDYLGQLEHTLKPYLEKDVNSKSALESFETLKDFLVHRSES